MQRFKLISRTMSTVALQNVWNTILGYNLTADNKRWLADHLYEQIGVALPRTELQPYTIDELYARVDAAEADIAAGRVYSRDEMSKMMNDFVAQYE